MEYCLVKLNDDSNIINLHMGNTVFELTKMVLNDLLCKLRQPITTINGNYFYAYNIFKNISISYSSGLKNKINIYSGLNINYNLKRYNFNIDEYSFKTFISNLKFALKNLDEDVIDILPKNFVKSEPKHLLSMINPNFIYERDSSSIVTQIKNKNIYLTNYSKFISNLFNYNDLVIPYKEGSYVEQSGPTNLYLVRNKYIFLSLIYDAISHQIAHMVEMWPFHRCLQDDWGLPIFYKRNIGNQRKTINISREYYFKSIVRECKVRAIQAVLEEKTLDETINRHPIIQNFVDDFLPFKKFNTEKDVHEWNAHIFETTYKKYNLDRIEHDWKQRIDYICNHIE